MTDISYSLERPVIATGVFRTRSRQASWSMGSILLLLLLAASPAFPQAQTSFGSNNADICYRESQLPLSSYGIQYCTSAIRKDNLLRRDLAATYTNRGIIYSAVGQFDAAMKDHNEALLLTPKTVKIYINRGNVFHRIHEYEKALADYDRAIEPGGMTLDTIYYNRALTLIRLERWDDAKASLEDGLEANPEAEYIRRKLEEINTSLVQPAKQSIPQ